MKYYIVKIDGIHTRNNQIVYTIVKRVKDALYIFNMREGSSFPITEKDIGNFNILDNNDPRNAYITVGRSKYKENNTNVVTLTAEILDENGKNWGYEVLLGTSEITRMSSQKLIKSNKLHFTNASIIDGKVVVDDNNIFKIGVGYKRQVLVIREGFIYRDGDYEYAFMQNPIRRWSKESGPKFQGTPDGLLGWGAGILDYDRYNPNNTIRHTLFDMPVADISYLFYGADLQVARPSLDKHFSDLEIRKRCLFEESNIDIIDFSTTCTDLVLKLFYIIVRDAYFEDDKQLYSNIILSSDAYKWILKSALFDDKLDFINGRYTVIHANGYNSALNKINTSKLIGKTPVLVII